MVYIRYLSLYMLVTLQTITGAMAVLNPPVPLYNPEHQFRVDYIQNETTKSEFSYPPVSYCLFFVPLGFFVLQVCFNTCWKHRDSELQECLCLLFS